MSRKSRSIAAIVVALTALAVAGLFVPAVSAAPGDKLVFVTQPQDSVAGQSIRTADLSQGSEFVQVKLVDANGITITNGNVKVTIALVAGPGLVVNNSIDAATLQLVNGVATFAPVGGEPTLSIGTPNEPQFTSYAIIPVSAQGPKIPGEASAQFDIFQDGESCLTAGTCTADLPHGNGNGDAYSVPNVTVGTTLGASQLSESTLPGFDCDPTKESEIFEGSVFVNVTTESDTDNLFAPVKLVSHVTRQEMKKAANNGQAHVRWCVALKSNAAWLNNGTVATLQNVQNDTNPDNDLWVAYAPACPRSSPTPQNFAPCIVSQTGDGNGGSITTGWLPGGDPPRRT